MIYFCIYICGLKQEMDTFHAGKKKIHPTWVSSAGKNGILKHSIKWVSSFA